MTFQVSMIRQNTHQLSGHVIPVSYLWNLPLYPYSTAIIHENLMGSELGAVMYW